MKYAGLKINDCVDGDGIVVSFWTQGCPHRCPGCHNPETWDFDGGMELPNDIKGQIIKAISANGVMRNFSVLGGEPLCDENKELVDEIVTAVRITYPDIKIYLWTGYEYDTLIEKCDDNINHILNQIDILIDGPFVLAERDLTLELRGSHNQKIHKLTNR